ERVRAVAPHQPGADELVAREPLRERLARQRVAAEGEAESELARDLLREPAALQVVAGEGADLRLPQRSLVEGRRLVEELCETRPPVPARSLLGRDVLVLDRNAEALCEPLDRTREVEPLRLAHEGDQVAALVAAEAVVEAHRRVDGEARRPLLVEGAPADEPRAPLAQ